MHQEISGLTDNEVRVLRTQFGDNVLRYKEHSHILKFLKNIVREPMIVLLLVAAILYAIEGATADSIFLGGAILFVAAISLFQEHRSNKALNSLKKLSRPFCKVIRNDKETAINSDEIVVGDVIIVDEGALIPADGFIIHSNDFSVNESSLTGESLPILKDTEKEQASVFRGTIVVSGLAYVKVTATGNHTRLGAIGASIEQVSEEQSPLERSLRNFVKKMTYTGVLVFTIVWCLNYYRDAMLLTSLLKSLTLAMSILPEEIPVALTSFMALAALRLMKKGIVVKQMKTVETLGSATVICADKTGTITQNKMTLAALYEINTGKICTSGQLLNAEELELLRMAMWASEPTPFDPMETALHEAYEKHYPYDERAAYTLVYEYPLSGRPPMMTHVFENMAGERIIAAKGAPEAMIMVSALSEIQNAALQLAIDQLSQKGYRVLGVGASAYNGSELPKEQHQFSFTFKGLVAFHDPPKENIRQVLESFYGAGISVKIITGDNATTTKAIANSVGFKGYDRCIEGKALMQLNDADLLICVQTTNIFTRMFPEAKLRVINALKKSGAIVAMTGDGINDGPALKAAHIGIAMGRKGTETARQVASLILLEDDLAGMVEAIATGRKIYANLKKAVRYIISIHIPIILSVFVPLALGWPYPNILSPIHIIFLELIMGPTCSLIFENEPMEADAMHRKPRPYNIGFFNYKELILSIVQGLVIALAALAIYRYGIMKGYTEAAIRSMVFTLLITSNIMLTLVNRSFYYSIAVTIQYKNKLVPTIIIITILLATTIAIIPPLRTFFGLTLIHIPDFAITLSSGILSVVWMEGWKWHNRNNPAIKSQM